MGVYRKQSIKVYDETDTVAVSVFYRGLPHDINRNMSVGSAICRPVCAEVYGSRRAISDRPYDMDGT